MGVIGLVTAMLLLLGVGHTRPGLILAVVVWGVSFGAANLCQINLMLGAAPDTFEAAMSINTLGYNTSIALGALSDDDIRSMLRGMVPGLPDDLVEGIRDRSEGVPLYAVETVRMLVSEGRLVEESGVYVPRGDLTTLAVPETLQALIASRLDGLDEAERRLVHDAAVLGQSFNIPALSAVAEVPENELEPRLASLVRRELLTLESDARSPERGQYAFVQALIREVAYNTLARRDRKTRHLAAARFLEGLASDGNMSPLQEALWECHSFQCGSCPSHERHDR